MYQGAKYPRVLVIGLDGGTLHLVEEWAEEGKLPNLKNLMERSCRGILKSTIPPVTPCGWTTFMTGKNPGKHGIFSFQMPQRGTYKLRATNAGDCRAATLWKILNAGGYRVGALNVPWTYPPEEIEGFIIAGLGSPAFQEDIFNPSSLYHEILREVGSYPIKDKLVEGEKKSLIEVLEEQVEKQSATARYLLRNYPVEVFVVVFNITDHIQHTFWRDRTTQLSTGEVIEDVVLQGYQKADQEIGRLLEFANEDTTVIIMSDHGGGPIVKAFNPNRFLANLGLLSYIADHQVSVFGKAKSSLGALMQPVARPLIALMRRGMPRGEWEQVKKRWLPQRVKVGLESFLFPHGIDWTHTKAYCFAVHGSILINLRGRYPQGIVEPSREYEELREEIIKNFLEVRDPETNSKIFNQVYRREELYRGPYVPEAPDVILGPTNPPYYVMPSVSTGVDVFFDSWREFHAQGAHIVDGMLIVSGKNITQASEITGAKLEDLAPTILYLLGLPIPEDMDGKVLTDLFVPAVVEEHPPKTGSAFPDREPAVELTPEEEEKIKERLRGLGYIE